MSGDLRRGLQGSTEDTLDQDWDDDSPEDTGSPTRQQRAAKGTLRQVSPFDIRFSQLRARAEFRDARSVETAIEEIKSIRCDTADDLMTPETPIWLLQAPFPTIEVMQWRCKLREISTGRPRVDSKTGGEIYASQEHLFALDNRRLYCLQQAAAKLWPEKVVVEVLDLPSGTPTRLRELKKFRTNDSGRSILIGGRGEGETLFRWSWRDRVGVEDDVSDANAEDCPVHMRRRASRGSQPSSWANNGKGPAASTEETFLDRLSSRPYTNFCLFLAVYVALRVGGWAFSAFRDGAPASSVFKFEDGKGAIVMFIRIAMVVMIGFLVVSASKVRR